jgi:hypothetical protein
LCDAVWRRTKISATVNPSQLVAIVACIEVDDVGHEFEICTVLQIYRRCLEPLWVPLPILQPERHTNGAGKRLLCSATWELYDLHFALIWAYRSAVRLTSLCVFIFVSRIFIGVTVQS